MEYVHVSLPDQPSAICLPEILTDDTMAMEAGPDIISRLPDLPDVHPFHQTSVSDSLYQPIRDHCLGKELLYEELEWDWHALKPFLTSGLLSVRSGLFRTKKGLCCRRCGNTSRERFGYVHCARCGRSCAYCRHCVRMGRITSCSALLRWTGPVSFPESGTLLKWEGTLSKGQEKAAQAIIEAVDAKTEILIWAVCGAGKTEILFPGLARALQHGERVLLAAPRTDVVLELLPRLRKVFPETTIAGLYGKSEEKHEPAQLVLATTHQMMRFSRAFDMVIIDEVDAFPYSADSSLVQAVQKAAKSRTTRIHLTATPTRSLQKQVKKETLPCVRIPRRYHGYPLPVPRFQWTDSWRQKLHKHQLPKPAADWCRTRMEQSTPAFLFVPSLEVLGTVTTLLQTINPGVEGVHSADAERLEKVKRFRSGDIPLLVTTTILERGVTVDGVEVGVLGAEAPIFTESALVQIAGRVGRNKEIPRGDVVFFHAGKTEAMVAAVRHITAMNKRPGG